MAQRAKDTRSALASLLSQAHFSPFSSSSSSPYLVTKGPTMRTNTLHRTTMHTLLRAINATITSTSYPQERKLLLSTVLHLVPQKTKAAASWLRPLVLVTKHAAGRLTPPPPTTLRCQHEKSRPHKLKHQRRKPRALQLNAACDSIVRSRLRRHANRIVGHFVQVCEQIRVDQVGLMDDWVAAMAEVGLTSMLAGNHPTSPISLLPLLMEAVLIPEPGLRIKARLASLRRRTNAVAASIPATTCESKSSLPWRCTS